MHIIRLIKSITVGVLILSLAVGCFFTADFLLKRTHIAEWVVLSAFGPIENVFLLLFTPMIALAVMFFGLNSTKAGEGAGQQGLLGVMVFLGCEIMGGVFGIPGVGFFLVATRAIREVLVKRGG